MSVPSSRKLLSTVLSGALILLSAGPGAPAALGRTLQHLPKGQVLRVAATPTPAHRTPLAAPALAGSIVLTPVLQAALPTVVGVQPSGPVPFAALSQTVELTRPLVSPPADLPQTEQAELAARPFVGTAETKGSEVAAWAEATDIGTSRLAPANGRDEKRARLAVSPPSKARRAAPVWLAGAAAIPFADTLAATFPTLWLAAILIGAAWALTAWAVKSRRESARLAAAGPVRLARSNALTPYAAAPAASASAPGLAATQAEPASRTLIHAVAAAAGVAASLQAAQALRGLFERHGAVPRETVLSRVSDAADASRREKASRRALEALAAGLQDQPLRRDAALLDAWETFRPALEKLLDSGPSTAARPPPKSAEGRWLAELSRQTAAQVGLPVDAAYFETRALMSGMDRSTPALLWLDPATGMVRLRVHRSVFDYAVSRAGAKRMAETGLANPEALIPTLVRHLSGPHLASRASGVDEAHAAIRRINPKDSERLSETLRSAGAMGNLYVKFMRWQSLLGLPLLPYVLWLLLKGHSLMSLVMPPAGLAALPFAFAAFALFAWLGPKLYQRAVERGWIPGSDRNVAYPILTHMRALPLLFTIPTMAFIEEAFFRRDLLRFFIEYATLVLQSGFAAAFAVSTLIASFFFSIAHIPNYFIHRMSAKQFLGSGLYFMAAGTILSIVYWLGGFLIAGVLHALYNGWIVWKEKTKYRGVPAVKDPSS